MQEARRIAAILSRHSASSFPHPAFQTGSNSRLRISPKSYRALNIIGKKYLNTPPMIQMMSIRLRTTAPPSIIADRRVAPRLSNSWCPASLRRECRRFLTQNCSQKTNGIRARAISKLYSGFPINQPSLVMVGVNFSAMFLLFLFWHRISPESQDVIVTACVKPAVLNLDKPISSPEHISAIGCAKQLIAIHPIHPVLAV
jgi:hypothetical protein